MTDAQRIKHMKQNGWEVAAYPTYRGTYLRREHHTMSGYTVQIFVHDLDHYYVIDEIGRDVACYHIND